MSFQWRVVPFTEVVSRSAGAAADPAGGPAAGPAGGPIGGERPAIVAVDGRGSGGKTTLAGRLADAVAGAVVVHTDDIAWHHAVLAWDDLLVDGVLRPAWAGQPVAYRPPQWDARGRAGSIDVPAGCPLLLVEGVGAGRRSLARWYDTVIWVETPQDLTERRNDVRVAAGETSPGNYALWMAEENPFVEAERTWDRADIVVNGAGTVSHDPDTEVVIA